MVAVGDTVDGFTEAVGNGLGVTTAVAVMVVAESVPVTVAVAAVTVTDAVADKDVAIVNGDCIVAAAVGNAGGVGIVPGGVCGMVADADTV